ncbi:MarR family winged helix-turn-helix transcriptional regulator [Comamonas sp. GB3 AK4-5]|uniref:MarR family winged helix-turn-helix transcriptional regulator n=1 Tax=Comamonas sp. GB3 AK4-5 TaxID=3231487 RepID=UPI00351E1DA1
MDHTPLPSAVLDTLHDLTLAYRRQMRATLEAQALPLPLTPNELKILLYVGRNPLCTHKDLVAYTGADKAQVARMLQQMETAQWLERVPHPQDKRSRCLRLSAQGETAFTALRNHRNQLGEQMLQTMPAAQQRELLAGLRQMHAQLHALPLPCKADGSAADVCEHPNPLHD